MGLSRYREQLRPATLVLAVAGLLMLLLVLGAAVFADLLAAHPPDRSTGLPYEAPSADHLLGTDDLGRDLWSQLVYGARVSLWVGLVAAVVATVVGAAAALVAGWHRGWVDAVIMRVVDLTLSLPFLVLVLVLAAYFGRGLDVLIVLIAGVLWARPARLLRGQVLKIREFGHTEAAHAMGAGSTRIMTVHILWRLVPLLVSQFVRAAAVAVIVQSGVAFLGLGDPGRHQLGIHAVLRQQRKRHPDRRMAVVDCPARGCAHGSHRRAGLRGVRLRGAGRSAAERAWLEATEPAPAA